MQMTTTISVKMLYFVNGLGRRVTLYREVYDNCKGPSDDVIVDLLNAMRRENTHIEGHNIWVESTTTRIFS